MNKFCVFAGALALAISTVALADDGPETVIIDISGQTSNGFQGDPGNRVINVDGFNVDDVIESIKWDFVLTTLTPSWADEPRIGISDGATTIATLGPFGSATTVTSLFVSGAMNVGHVMQGNRLNLEFYESGFDDLTGADAIYVEGSIRINYTPVPAPAVLATLGVAGLVSRRRRRNA